jgi:hypothetical protein
LDAKLIPVLKSNPWHVKLTGMASKSGSRDQNRQLSLSRLLHVKAYLQQKGIPEAKLPGTEIRAFGSDLSKSKDDNDPNDRAVRLTVAVGTRPMPIRRDTGGFGLGLPVPEYARQKPWLELKMRDIRPPDIRQRVPDFNSWSGILGDDDIDFAAVKADYERKVSKLSTHFKIRQLGEFDVGFLKIFGANYMRFMIADPRTRKYVICSAESSLIGYGTPVSVTLGGPWNDFETNWPVDLGEFNWVDVSMANPPAIFRFVSQECN